MGFCVNQLRRIYWSLPKSRGLLKAVDLKNNCCFHFDWKLLTDHLLLDLCSIISKGSRYYVDILCITRASVWEPWADLFAWFLGQPQLCLIGPENCITDEDDCIMSTLRKIRGKMLAHPWQIIKIRWEAFHFFWRVLLFGFIFLLVFFVFSIQFPFHFISFFRVLISHVRILYSVGHS